MPARLSARILSCLALLLATFFLPMTAQAADYRLEPGDILEISIAGVPGFLQRAPIDLQGIVALPFAGQVKVGALTLPQARAAIAQEFSNTLYRHFAPDGREISHLILSEKVN